MLVLAGLLLTATVCSANVQVWLLLNPDLTDSVLSSDAKERDVLVQAGWKVNGTGSLRLDAEKGAVPLHRMYRQGGGRMLEVDPASLKNWEKQGYVDEGVLGHASAKAKPGLIPVYHVTKGTTHLWFINPTDQQAALKSGWKPVPTTFWFWPAEAP